MPKVSFPHMGHSYIALKSLLEELGNEVIVPPQPSAATLTLGTKYSPEFACVPYKIVLGTYLEVLKKGANTLIASGGNGPCRAGHYAMLHEKILRDLGYKFRMIVFELPRRNWLAFYRNLKAVNAAGHSWMEYYRIGMRCWQKLVALDAIERLSHKIRPREAEKGLTTKRYKQGLRLIDRARTDEEIVEARKQAEDLLKTIPQKPVTPLRIGLVGEIYVLLEPFANLEIEEALGELGVEVERSLFITGWTLDNTVTDTLGKVGGLDIKKAAAPYLPEMIGGHGQDSVGHTVIYSKAGFDGVIQLAPFTCIPEIVAKGILPKVSRDHDIPVLSISCDELTGRAGLLTRLEAFVDLLERRRARKEWII